MCVVYVCMSGDIYIDIDTDTFPAEVFSSVYCFISLFLGVFINISLKKIGHFKY